MKVLKIELKRSETNGRIRLTEGEPLEYKTIILDHEEREYPLHLLKNVFGDFDHPHYEVVYKRQPKYRSFDLSIVGTYEDKKIEDPSLKRKADKEEEEVEFPFLKIDEVQCKQLNKTNGKRCKKDSIKNGFCSLHQPKED